MVHIEYDQNVLIVNVTERPDLFFGQYSLMFREQGFAKSESSMKYVMDDPIKIRSTVDDLIAFFRRKRIPVQMSEKFDQLNEQIGEEKQSFEAAAERGLTVKEGTEELQAISLPGFQRKLKSYQEKAVHHMLAVRHSANFSVPGSGKTTMLYAGFSVWREANEVEKIFVIGPPSSFMAWEEEYAGCFGRPAVSYRLLGPDRDRKYKTTDRADLFLTSFQTASIDTDRLIELMQKHRVMLVVDESHYIKRFENGTWANALLKLAPYAKRRAISTGTPMPNGLFDLYSQMTFLWPGKFLLGEQNQYKAEVKRNEDDVEWIQNKIRPFFYRINKKDLELPPLEIQRVTVPMSDLQQQIYDVIAARTIEELERFSSREVVEIARFRRAKIIRLVQAASNPALLADFSQEFQIPPLTYDGGDFVKLIEQYSQFEKPNKLQKSIELAQTLVEQGYKVLLWSTFVNNIFQLRQDFVRLGIPSYLIFGGVPKSDEDDEEFNREQQIRLFKQSDKPCILIANPAACAESISLHKDCHHAIYLDRSFNCGHYLQSLDRIHRIGLPEDQMTTYYFLESEGAVDEVIHQRLQEKAWLMRSVIDMDMPIGSMDLDQDEWGQETELQKDFESVIQHIRSKRA
ncbi:DEAD/DEAH box helicase [Paenibacillus sp. FSL K6-1230]|uniref:DEAD/DEAH box helicase n=1 Tax=Paenibacillus sp. FSL K6-1230 TaxID=2921603 RepID=UPI0030FC3699